MVRVISINVTRSEGTMTVTTWTVAVRRCLLSLETVGADTSLWLYLVGDIQNTLFVHSIGALFLSTYIM